MPAFFLLVPGEFLDDKKFSVSKVSGSSVVVPGNLAAIFTFQAPSNLAREVPSAMHPGKKGTSVELILAESKYGDRHND